MTQAQFGKRLKVSRQYVSMIEGGLRSPDIGFVQKACMETGITIAVWTWLAETHDFGGSVFVNVVDLGMGWYYGIKIERGKDGVVTGIHKL